MRSIDSTAAEGPADEAALTAVSPLLLVLVELGLGEAADDGESATYEKGEYALTDK